MESRSGTSSPDPLGPPGDAEYLISSPLKPLSDYRHVMSSPKPRTPSVQTRKKTNSKSSQPVRLQDIVMSATPTPGRNGDRLSPTKSTMHSENNLSPWRIRVTVEAEHEDDINNGNGAGRNSLPGSMTTKVPLKLENSSPSPKKKRGRPRKSEASPGKLTPSKGNRTPKAKSDSGGKRKRAGPRKSLPDSDVAESIEGGDLLHPNDAKSGGDRLFDIAVDHSADQGIAPQVTNFDDFDNDILLDQVSSNNSSPGESKKRLSNLPSLPSRVLDDLDGDGELTPMKPSPSGRKRTEVSPENTINAGHTPGPRSRFYPTPTTSSSLVEDERQAKPPHTSVNDEMQIDEPDDVVDMVDVTQGHREFDTIMESEGFSMVSLDTLPSAKQQMDSTSKITSQASSSQASKMKPPAIASTKMSQTREAQRLSRSPNPQPLQNLNKSSSQSKYTPAVNNNSSPKQPPAPVQEVQPQGLTAKKSIPRLARVVRSGIALQGVLDRRNRNSRLRSPFSSPGQYGSKSPADRKKRLDDLFQGFDIETQRELRAGLRFGEQLANRQREAEAERRNREARRPSETPRYQLDELDQDPMYPKLPMSDFGADAESPMREEYDLPQDTPVQPATPARQSHDLTQNNEVSSEMQRREAEWQREREAISREIQMANSSQVIVIDSDDDNGNVEQNPPSNMGEEAHDDYGEEYIDEDDDYEDIWQLEARDPDPLGESTSYIHEPEQETNKPRRSGIPSPWKRGEEVDYDRDAGSAPSLFKRSRSQRGPTVLSNIETQMKKLREQEVDISALLKEQAAQSRVFYEDDEQPVSAQKKRSPASPPKRQKLEVADSSSQRESSPFRYSKADTHPRRQQKPSPVKSPPKPRETEQPAPAESEWESPSPEEDFQPEDEDLLHESPSQSAHEQEDSSIHETPEQPVPEAHATPSWFRSKLTSFTPNWLKSPAVKEIKSPSPDPSIDSPEAMDFEQNPSELSNSHQQQQPSPHVQHSPATQKPEPKSHHSRRSTTTKGLATSGYFTNDHYSLLRRLYRQAKATPELFPYNPTPERSEMLGTWMWSADGLHSRPITELQIAIVDRFIQELIHNSTRNRFESVERRLGWSEEELVRRLFSIIVGERVRKERKLREAGVKEGRRDGVRRRRVEMEL
ncbi:hypothetical protein FQN54_001754 [Arachnomyces sp. PD_36]|nr:hypothetical protein FQN54_001754 [Arachnomyces sp. PD_36]